MFAPFEVPLVQEREYEFTATTSHKYVRVHFVIDDNDDKWVSIRKMEPNMNIFSQILSIPKGTRAVELGVSNRANAKEKDVDIYAVYSVIPLGDFKNFIEAEENIREYEEKSSGEDKPVLEYGKIIIDHKYTTKYPQALKRGGKYTFEIGPFDRSYSYCILNASNDDNFLWLPVERKKDRTFKITYQIPGDAENFRIALSSTSTTFIESLVSFNLYGDVKTSKENRIEDGENIVISSSSISNLYIPVDDEKIYKLSVDKFSSDYKYCQVFCNDENGNSLDFFVLDFDERKDMYETNCFYVPDGTATISLYLSDDYFYSLNKVAQIEVDDRKIENPLKAGKNIHKGDEYRTDEPDSELMAFLDRNDAKRIGNSDPDRLVDLCIDYILENAFDDFHKIKLLHDAIWYLASYDHDSLEIGDYWPWDYRTVLSRGLCVCAGFSRTFVYFCDKMGIRAINVLGNALLDDEKTVDELENSDHAWTMVELEDGWYLFDLTWDCSNTKNGKNDGKYSCTYFFVEPKDFLMQHYPNNPEKQLLENPYSSREMLELLRNNRR